MFEFRETILEILKKPDSLKIGKISHNIKNAKEFLELLQQNHQIIKYTVGDNVKLKNILFFLFDFDKFLKLSRLEKFEVVKMNSDFKILVDYIFETKSKLCSKQQKIDFENYLKEITEFDYSFDKFYRIFKVSKNFKCVCGENLQYKHSKVFCPKCDDIHKCDFCNELFTSDYFKKEHIYNFHSEETQKLEKKEQFCPYCRAICNSKGALVLTKLYGQLYMCPFECYRKRKTKCAESIKQFKVSRSKNTDSTNYSSAAILREKKFKETIDTKTGLTKKQQISRACAPKQSETMKNKIASGEFTPCVTNSWCKSRTVVDNIPFRSSWEAFYYIFNKHNSIMLEYETKIVPYFDTLKNSFRNYIIDFFDYNKNILYEIKPSGFLESQNVLDKELGVQLFLENNVEYSFVYISNEWFLKNYSQLLVENATFKTEEMKVNTINRLKQFKGFTC